MRKLLFVLLTLLAVGTISGCGGDKEKGIYKDQDRPKSDDKDR
jgi:hypothetical protein